MPAAAIEESILKAHPSIMTPRLILKPQSLHDFDRFFAMSKDPDVMAYIGDGSIFHWTRSVALAKFKEQLASPKGVGMGTLAIYQRADSLYLGWCAIAHSRFLNHMELGYRLCRDGWRNGFATEAAAAMLGNAYQIPNLNQIQACVHPDNQASIRVLEKLGFAFACTKFSKPIGKDLLVYGIQRSEFSDLWPEMINRPPGLG